VPTIGGHSQLPASRLDALLAGLGAAVDAVGQFHDAVHHHGRHRCAGRRRLTQDGRVTPARLVRSATLLAPVPFVPEISLYQADDIYAVWELTERALGQPDLPPPFWSVVWPGGQALARYLLDHPALVTGRTVLDVGSGSGLVAIAAARAGAAVVLAAEPDPLAAAAIAVNAAANDVPVPVCVGDATGAGVRADVVVAGDVWYERELADQVSAYLDEVAAAGADVLTGDIGRRYFPRGRYQCLASYEIPASLALEGSALLRASVGRLESRRPGSEPGL
jgi:predicted nicotinamide N-methyase